MSKKPAAPTVTASQKASKPKGNARAEADARAIRDECVSSILDLLLGHIQQHIQDKFVFPQTLAHAVGRTMAEIVHMVSIAHVQRMEDWLVHLEGSAPEEWDNPPEPLVPLIDSWARGVVPLKKMPGSSCSSPCLDDQQQQQQESGSKQPRRGSAMALSQYQDQSPRRRLSSDVGTKQKGLRGSLRRFSDGFHPLDPTRKVKFQEHGGLPDQSAPKTSPLINSDQQVGNFKNNNQPTQQGERHLSLSKEDKNIKGVRNKTISSTKKNAS